MISDLDETLKQLLIKKGQLDPAEIHISFEMLDYDRRLKNGRGTRW